MITAAKISQVGTGTKNLAIGLAVLAATAGVIYAGYKVKQGLDAAGTAAGKAVDAVGKALDPTADTNVAYKASNSLIGCGDGSCSLGTKVYDAVDAVRGWFK